MKLFKMALMLVAFSSPLTAQSADPPVTPEPFGEFTDRMRDLLDDLAQDIAPMLNDLNEKLRGLGQYEAPEILPNGDIIIRRKPDLDGSSPTAPDGMIDL